MAEIKNAFIQSKMNKDLDARLLPSGEYRNAVNAQVSKSESSDVGALQTALGNSLVIEFFPEIPGLKSIGYFADQISNTAYVFLTDHTGSDYNPSANNIICAFNISTNSFSVLAEGAFLNFSTQNPIYGVNLLESLLFWTDNRNQPRKINVLRPLGYYTAEEQISVAKYNPFQTIELWQDSVLIPGEYETTIKDVVSPFLPDGGSVFVPSYVADASASLFSTNTRNGTIDVGLDVWIITPSGVLEPLLSTTGDPASLFEYRYNLGLMKLTSIGGDPIEIPAGSTIVFKPNPYFNNEFFGDYDFLEDKFPRFSYRFKFDDGEYSIFAPFTQIAFIPKQDGYFQYYDYATITSDPDEPIKDDQAYTYKTTEVALMENKANEVELRIPLYPFQKSALKTDLKLVSIDILYKESEALGVQVIETVSIDDIVSSVEGGEDYYVYKYGSQKPYKTLPSNELIRVYDKIPVKALSQEIISNRVVYGNFQDKHTPLPANIVLNYNVAVDSKRSFSTAENFTSIIEYPNHNLKQNRNYQVGVVFADKFGRQSTTLLSPSDASIMVGSQLFSGSTVFVPYLNANIPTASFPGNSLKVLFNDPIPTDRDGNYPGVYNGDVNSIDYNPLGWYSYKIVVKQTEQDYYNVYLPGAVAGYPGSSSASGEYGSTSFAVLINDNINKVPRDLQQVGPTQKQFRSSVALNGRVVNTTNATYHNAQFYPEKGDNMTVSTIADGLEMFYGSTTDPTTIPPIPPASVGLYNWESNPLVAKISTPTKFGERNNANVIQLTVAETDPVDSRLDIFWETSTTGLISDLNEAIFADTGGVVKLTSPSYNSFDETITAGGADIFDTPLKLYTDISGDVENSPVGYISNFTMTVENTEDTPAPVNNYFTLIGDANPTAAFPTWNVKVTNDFFDNVFYMTNEGMRNFKFTFSAVVNGINVSYTRYINLINVNPLITTPVSEDIVSTISTEVITALSGVNGSGNYGLQALDLNWEITSQTREDSPGIQVPYFTLNSYASPGFPSGEVWTAELINTEIGTLPAARYAISMQLSDAGASDTETFIVDFTVTPNQVDQYEVYDSSTGYTYYFVILTITNQAGTIYYYPYTGDWATLSAGGSLISIPSTGYGCGISWPTPSTSLTAAKGAARTCLGYSSGLPETITNINIDTFTFAFV